MLQASLRPTSKICRKYAVLKYGDLAQVEEGSKHWKRRILKKNKVSTRVQAGNAYVTPTSQRRTFLWIPFYKKVNRNSEFIISFFKEH